MALNVVRSANTAYRSQAQYRGFCVGIYSVFSNPIRRVIAMGNLATPETLSLRWAEILTDPTLQTLPHKLELNARGKIEMSPASIIHGGFQARHCERAQHAVNGR